MALSPLPVASLHCRALWAPPRPAALPVSHPVSAETAAAATPGPSLSNHLPPTASAGGTAPAPPESRRELPVSPPPHGFPIAGNPKNVFPHPDAGFSAHQKPRGRYPDIFSSSVQPPNNPSPLRLRVL